MIFVYYTPRNLTCQDKAGVLYLIIYNKVKMTYNKIDHIIKNTEYYLIFQMNMELTYDIQREKIYKSSSGMGARNAKGA